METAIPGKLLGKLRPVHAHSALKGVNTNKNEQCKGGQADKMAQWAAHLPPSLTA